MMAMIGLILWFTSHVISPRNLVLWMVVPLLAFLAWLCRRDCLETLACPLERRALAVIGLVMLVATAKATYSLGAVGELYAGEVSRTLESEIGLIVGFRFTMSN